MEYDGVISCQHSRVQRGWRMGGDSWNGISWKRGVAQVSRSPRLRSTQTHSIWNLQLSSWTERTLSMHTTLNVSNMYSYLAKLFHRLVAGVGTSCCLEVADCCWSGNDVAATGTERA